MRAQAVIPKPDCEPITCKAQIQYLGSTLSDAGKLGSELGRRIGEAIEASETFCIINKLASGLQSTFLNKTVSIKLDSFRAFI